jgi:large subunit ribosomal protein L18
MKKHTVPFQRKLKGKTDYNKRLYLLQSGKPRVAIRGSVKNMQIQLIQYEPKGDKIIFTVHTSELKKLGWNFGLGNIPSAYLAGLLAAKKAKQSKIDEAIVDIGMQSSVKGGRIFAAVKGLIDGGLKVPASEEAFPSAERLIGKHIVNYAKGNVANLEKEFSAMKAKILGN